MADGSGVNPAEIPTVDLSVRDTFGIDSDMVVKGFPEPAERVPLIDDTYRFEPATDFTTA